MPISFFCIPFSSTIKSPSDLSDPSNLFENVASLPKPAPARSWATWTLICFIFAFNSSGTLSVCKIL